MKREYIQKGNIFRQCTDTNLILFIRIDNFVILVRPSEISSKKSGPTGQTSDTNRKLILNYQNCVPRVPMQVVILDKQGKSNGHKLQGRSSQFPAKLEHILHIRRLRTTILLLPCQPTFHSQPPCSRRLPQPPNRFTLFHRIADHVK